MTRGEYFLEGWTAVKAQLAIPYWAGSPQTSCYSNLVAPGEIPDFSEKFLLIQEPYLKQNMDKNDNKTKQNNLRIEN